MRQVLLVDFMEFRIEFDSTEAKGRILIYEEWKKGKEKRKILGEQIGSVDFCVDNVSLTVTSLDVVEKYRRKGLGRLIMGVIFSLAVYYNRKVELVSGNENASKFYRAIGMKPKSKKDSDEFVWKPRKKRNEKS